MSNSDSDNPYTDTEYLKERWNYSNLEILHQELNNLLRYRVSGRNYHAGLVFKTIGGYTTTGLMSGEPGWYMKICWDDYLIIVADRSPEIVLQKAIYWFTYMKNRSATDPRINQSFMKEWKPTKKNA